MVTLQITPPGGSPETITAFKNCSVTLSATSRTGNFSVNLIAADEDIYDKYPIGSDVRITMDGNVFRGWILNPMKQLDGLIKIVSLQGLCYTGRTQKIMVTENYTNQKISDIVEDLFTKYAPEYNQDSIVNCNKVISLKINDKFLFDVMEQLANLAGYEWFIDEPAPEEINAAAQSTGWFETVEARIHQVIYPGEDLYPSEGLFPC